MARVSELVRMKATAVWMCLLALVLAAGCATPGGGVDAAPGAVPWTTKVMGAAPETFRFAIVADRTGRARDGVFESAIERLNLMQPDFVMSVGDLIEGGTDDADSIKRQWDEFDGIVAGLKMRFFHVPGNHDVGRAALKGDWDRRHGRRYYSFMYKDVLFLCLDAQDWDKTGPHLGAEQIDWAVGVLKRHADARWTFVFLHQPLWMWETGDIYKVGRIYHTKEDEPRETGFADIESALGGRRYTVFSGHLHSYMRFERQGAEYLGLGTTGGVIPGRGEKLRGPEYGEMDHIMWVTMGQGRPSIAVLTLDGILRTDVCTFEDVVNRQAAPVPDVTNSPTHTMRN